jgi:tetratricopeptide (TPR) repeat protein
MTRFKLVIAELIRQGFVSRRITDGREVYTIHRTVQRLIITEMNKHPTEREAIFQLTFNLVRHHLPHPASDTPEPAKWKLFRDYLPHVLSLQRAYADPESPVTISPFFGLAELFRDGGILLWQRYISADAMRLLLSALDILELLEEEHLPLLAELHTTIHLLLQYQGISGRVESKDHLGTALQLRTRIVAEARPKACAPDLLALIMARADFANAHLEFHDFEYAEPIYERCLGEFSDMFPSGPQGAYPKSTQVDVAKVFAKLDHHKAYCKMYRGDFPAAIELASRAIEHIARLQNKSLTLRYQFDLACIKLQSGDRQGAMALHEEVYRERVELNGPTSYFTLMSQYAVGAVHHYLRNLDTAEYVSNCFSWLSSLLTTCPPPQENTSETHWEWPSARVHGSFGPSTPSRDASTTSRLYSDNEKGSSRTRPRRWPATQKTRCRRSWFMIP